MHVHLLCLGRDPWDSCWTGAKHLLTRIARRGNRLLYVEPVSTPRKRLRQRFAVREVESGVHVLTCARGSDRSHELDVSAIRTVALQLRLSRIVLLTFRSDTASLIEALDPSAAVYYALAEDPRLSAANAGRLCWPETEEALLSRTDLALAVSRSQVERFSARQPRSFVLEPGVDTELFAPARVARLTSQPLLSSLPRPRFCAIPHAGHPLNVSLLVTLARARREWQIVVPGLDGAEDRDLTRLLAEPNIHRVDVGHGAGLAALLRECNACLLAYHTDAASTSATPLDVFDCVAAGIPVVSTPIEAARTWRDAIVMAATAQEFVQCVEAALRDPAADRDVRLSVARTHSWDARARELLERLEQAIDIAAKRRRHSARPRRVPPGAPIWHVLSARGALAFTATRVAGRLYHAARMLSRTLAGHPHPAVARILVVRNRCWLGDLIAILPALSALRAWYPSARIVLAVQPGSSVGPLIDGTGLVDEVRTLSDLDRTSARVSPARVADLFREGFDVVMTGAQEFLHRECFFSGARWQVGLDDGEPFQVLNTRNAAFDPARHESENNLAAAELVGRHLPASWRAPTVRLPAREAQGVTHSVEADLALPSGARVVTLHPGAKLASRRWPPEHFAALASRLLASHDDLWIVLTGIDQEHTLAEAVRTLVPAGLRSRVRNAAGATSLQGLMELLTRSAAVVCNDTGTMHLARAVGAPLVAVLGPENDLRWGPYPVGAGPAIAIRAETPCGPCRRRDCDELYCLRLTPPETVAAHVTSLLGPGRSGNGSLERRISCASWQDIADASLRVPLVSVVIAAPDGAPGRDGFVERVRHAVATTAAQTYPAIETVLLVNHPVALPGTGLPITLLEHPSPASVGAHRAALARCSGMFVTPVPAGAEWEAEKIAADVSVLVREPWMKAVECRLAEKTGATSWGAITWRRDALAHALTGEPGEEPARELLTRQRERVNVEGLLAHLGRPLLATTHAGIDERAQPGSRRQHTLSGRHEPRQVTP